MAFRFRKSFKLLPGVRLNVSKSGTSVSVGRRGASMNFRGDRVRTSVGVPGTGLSYSEETRSSGTSAASGARWTVLKLIALLVLMAVLLRLF